VRGPSEGLFRLARHSGGMNECDPIVEKRHILMSMNPMIVLVAFGAVAVGCLAQSTPATFSLGIVKLKAPEYPPIARVARVSGYVVLSLKLNDDGSPASVEAMSGPQMLRQAAVDSAMGSEFQPVPKDQVGHEYQVFYNFSLQYETCDDSPNQPLPPLKIEANAVTVSGRSIQTCDYASPVRVRSAKCLFLWKCGVK